MQIIEKTRKKPIQKRAVSTWHTLLDSVVHLLGQRGMSGLQIDRISEYSGYSVGTIYRYFTNKDSIIFSIFERELSSARNEIKEIFRTKNSISLEVAVSVLISIALKRMNRNFSARRMLILLVMQRGESLRYLEAINSLVDEMIREAMWREESLLLSRFRIRIVSMAILGAIRTTIITDPDSLDDPKFEADLVSIAIAALKAP